MRRSPRLDALSATRTALRTLARRHQILDDEIAQLDAILAELTARAAPRLLREPGIGPEIASRLLLVAVKALERPNLIIAGILTDVCLWQSVVSALDAGYSVQVVADASGTTSVLGDTVTYDRMRELGVSVGTTYGTLFELYPDLSTPEGQKAEMVAAGIPLPV